MLLSSNSETLYANQGEVKHDLHDSQEQLTHRQIEICSPSLSPTVFKLWHYFEQITWVPSNKKILKKMGSFLLSLAI